ncbi:Alpha/Beta hydrolase protein [Tricladium varicosporioides]|nr:Alpha/Beta hydrolase protein [Hymenoscyphus varicosporioides]
MEKSTQEELPLLSERHTPRAVNHEQTLTTNARRNRRPYAYRGAIIAFLFFVWWSMILIPKLIGPPPKDVVENDQLDWDQIPPSERLEWHDCYEKLKCARLTVPMDYNRPLNASKDNPKVHIAVVLVPGVHVGKEKASTSPLLLNPGGPGGSGVFIAVYMGRQIQAVVGTDQDVIGFDPRGIGATTPRADCFSHPPTDPGGEEDYVQGQYHRMLWYGAGSAIGVVNSSSVALKKTDERARAAAKLCEKKALLDGDDSIFRHLSTPTVATDMLSIVDAWDEWTATLESDSSNSKTAKNADNSLSTKGKLVYWGFSYGTLLGATFAAMFPDRVGRVALDGVVDADHYVAPVWSGSLQDTDATYTSFFRYCYEAGEKCAFYRKGDTIPEIQKRFKNIMDDIKENPITLIDPNANMPLVVSYSDIRRVIFSTLYAPTTTYPGVAMIMDFIYRGNLDILARIFTLSPMLELKPFCGPSPPAYFYPNEAQSAIMCSDKRYPLNETLPNLENIYLEMANLSSFADVWMTLMVGCDAWAIKAIDPPMRWDDAPPKKPAQIQTSFPLLFISNTADPVTPLYAGVKMAQKFKDAGLVEQYSEGHCSLTAVSRCTIGNIRAYFREGKVPPPPVKGPEGRELVDGKWVKCVADEWPWHPFEAGAWLEASGESDEGMIEAMEGAVGMKEFYKHVDLFGERASAPVNLDMAELLLRQ